MQSLLCLVVASSAFILTFAQNQQPDFFSWFSTDIELILPTAKEVHYAKLHYDKYRQLVMVEKALFHRLNGGVVKEIYDFLQGINYRTYPADGSCIAYPFNKYAGFIVEIAEGIYLDMEKFLNMDNFTLAGEKMIRDGQVITEKIARPIPLDKLDYGKAWWLLSVGYKVSKTHFEGYWYPEPMKLELSLRVRNSTSNVTAPITVFNFNANRPHLKLFDISKCQGPLDEPSVDMMITLPRASVSIRTTLQFNWEFVGVSLINRQYFTFQVKSCMNAYLMLTSNFGEYTGVKTYKIKLGMEGNVYSTIESDSQPAPPNARVHTPAILKCDEFRSFWVSWGSGNIQVGRGNKVYTATFMQWRDPQPLDIITSLAVTTSNELFDIGSWRINLQYALSVITEPNYRFEFLGASIKYQPQKFLIFQLVACSNAHILLAPKWNDVSQKVYDIIIGDYMGTAVTIRTAITGSEVKRVDTPGVLKCGTSKIFWVSWMNNVVELGTGYTKTQSSTLISWEDSDKMFLPEAIAVATEWNIRGLFKFYNIEADFSLFGQLEEQADSIVEKLINETRKTVRWPASILRITNNKMAFDDDNVYLTSTLLPLPSVPDSSSSESRDYIVSTAERLFGIVQDLVYSGRINVKLHYGMHISATQVRRSFPYDPNNFNDPNVKKFVKDAGRVLYVNKWTVDYGFTIQKCAMRCLTTERCVSFDYCPNVGECLMSDQHYAAGEDMGTFQNHSYCDHYAKSYIAGRFESTPGIVLTTTGESKEYYDLTTEHCAKWCVQERHFQCESFDYCANSRLCRLNTLHKDSSGVIVVNQTDCVHYSKAFLGKFNETSQMYLEGDAQTVIHEITKEQCAKTCLQETSFNCRSFNYCPTDMGKGTPSCIMNSHSRAELPGYKFISAEVCSYSERINASTIKIRTKTPHLQYSQGQMAGFGIGMLALGAAFGTGILAVVLFIKKK